MATILGTPKVQYFRTGTQEFLNGGRLRSFVAGTLTPTPTYPTVEDALNGTNANPNPVILDARGEANVVLSGPTKLELRDSDNTLIWTVDNVASTSGDIVDDNNNELIHFIPIAGAVNAISVYNASSGNGPIIESWGDDNHIDLHIRTKGNGDLFIEGDTEIDGDLLVEDNLEVGGNAVIDGNLDIDGELTVGGASIKLPAGFISWNCSSNNPDGWLPATGQNVSRTTYALLFDAIGTTFGNGDGSTTFTLPDLRRRGIMGTGGASTGVLGNSLGDTGGSETHTLTIGEMPPHTHTYNASNVATSSGSNQTVLEAVSSATTGSRGDGNPHNNIQPTIILRPMICTGL